MAPRQSAGVWPSLLNSPNNWDRKHMQPVHRPLSKFRIKATVGTTILWT